jgi:hypothetical protein
MPLENLGPPQAGGIWGLVLRRYRTTLASDLAALRSLILPEIKGVPYSLRSYVSITI